MAFEGGTLHEKVKVMIYWCDVKPYVPPLMRCFRCWKFRHLSSRCSSSPTCSECGCPAHPDAPCTPPPLCMSCGQHHPPCSLTCTILRQEGKIMETKSIPIYSEACKKYERLHPVRMVISFTAVTSSPALGLTAPSVFPTSVGPMGNIPLTAPLLGRGTSTPIAPPTPPVGAILPPPLGTPVLNSVFPCSSRPERVPRDAPSEASKSGSEDPS